MGATDGAAAGILCSYADSYACCRCDSVVGDSISDGDAEGASAGLSGCRSFLHRWSTLWPCAAEAMRCEAMRALR